MYLNWILSLCAVLTSAQQMDYTKVLTEPCAISRVQRDTSTIQMRGAKPIKNGYTGDVLNVTRCYCSDGNGQCGYYHQADYFNYHGDWDYQTHYSCVNDCGNLKDNCWWVETRRGHKMCQITDEENKFCYEFNFREYHLHVDAPGYLVV